MAAREPLHLALLNDWQRGFPLEPAPFARIGAALGLAEDAVIGHYRALLAEGALSRIGGVFAAGAGGAGVLAAMAVPAHALDAVAEQVSAHPGVNHNYEREHDWNLWFVMNGRDAGAVAAALESLRARAQVPMIAMPMQRAYRIDLGFDLKRRAASTRTDTRGEAPAPLAESDWPLAALIEQGLPLQPRPFDLWAERLAQPRDALLATLARWLREGTLRRFGAIVRHHELGFAANAMSVFDVPDTQVDERGAALAREPGVTLAYRRARAPGWPYNLYCMVHGRDRGSVQAVLAGVIERAGLAPCARQVLFSRRRFKQEGARRFRALEPEVCHAQ